MLSGQDLYETDTYFRAANYISLAQLYLNDNVMISQNLKHAHIKKPVLGHWGAVPGINFIYAHANRIIKTRQIRLLPLVGTGHSAAAILANLFIEGSLEEYYPEYTRDYAGLLRLARAFAQPDGMPTELSPLMPGCIHPGGELGHALGIAYGTVLDDPELITLAIIGDGEAETAPTAGAWHSPKFIHPKYSGAVLPIINANGFRMTAPSMFGMMTDSQLIAYFEGLGYVARIVHGDHLEMHEALSWSLDRIIDIQQSFRENIEDHRKYPVLILRTPKGWTAPLTFRGKAIVGHHRAHKAPISDAHKNRDALECLQEWLESYGLDDLFHNRKVFSASVLNNLPSRDYRLGHVAALTFNQNYHPIILPPISSSALMIDKSGEIEAKSAQVLGRYLEFVMELNHMTRNFRIFSPDELNSNGLIRLQQKFGRSYSYIMDEDINYFSPDGQIMEVLSEHLCQAWLQGYLGTGRHGIFVSYECFIPIVQSMTSQYIKFLKELSLLNSPTQYPSLNYFLTSIGWHNNYSHQNVDFYQTLVAKYGSFVRIYFPPDANSLLACCERSWSTHNQVNVIAAAKSSLPQWLTSQQASSLIEESAQIWGWVGAEATTPSVDLIICGIGDYATRECIAAISMLQTLADILTIRFVNVCEITSLGSPKQFNHSLSDNNFLNLFGSHTDAIIAFGGYPATIKSLLFDRPNPQRFSVLGYCDEGTTTTDKDMLFRNETSRYHIVVQGLKALQKKHEIYSNARVDSLLFECSEKIKQLQEGI